MKRFILFISTIIVCSSAYAQSRDALYERFSEIIQQQDTTAIVNLISDWERLYPDDAELYSLRANYAYKSAFHEIVIMSDELPSDVDRYLEITNLEDPSVIEGYMFSRIEVDSLKVAEVASILAEGVMKHPDRIDLRLGKVRAHFDSGDMHEAVDELVSALKYSKVNDNRWLTTLDVPVETDGVSYLRDCIQDCMFELIDADALSEAGSIIDTAVRCYPKDAIFLSDKAVIQYYSGDLKNALKTYLTASKYDPEDMLILNNIAQIYTELGNNKKALHYYRIIAESSDEEYAGRAKQAISEFAPEGKTK